MFQKIALGMDQCQNLDLGGKYFVDEAVRVNEEFPDIGVSYLRNNSAGFREGIEYFRLFNDFQRNFFCIEPRVPCDVITDLL